MEYAILAGGPPAHLPDLNDKRFDHVQWIGVDRGTLTLIKNGITPLQAFGDFDSIDERERLFIESKKTLLSVYPSEKDQTDLEIALDWVLEREPERCWIVGATGGRLDHSLMNIQLLVKGIGKKTKLILIDNQNIVTILPPNVYDITKAQYYPYVSFIAFSPKVTGISLEGFKYPLNKAELVWGSSLCISNELISTQGRLSFSEGYLICVQSRDA
ncbi:MAG: thiamine diphosphokinase [Tuberibacillus sp.]